MVRRAAHFGFLWTRRQRSLADSWNVQGERASNNEGAGQGNQIKEISLGPGQTSNRKALFFALPFLCMSKLKTGCVIPTRNRSVSRRTRSGFTPARTSRSPHTTFKPP